MPADPGSRTLKLCLVGNPDSIHVRRWALEFARRGFDVSIANFSQPEHELEGNPTTHFLRRRAGPVGRTASSKAGRSLRSTILSTMPGAFRLATAMRLRAAGFYRLLDQLAPDIVHGHYISDYGFLAAASGRRPLVISAWGSDLLIDPWESVVTRWMVRYALARADVVTYDADSLAAAVGRLGGTPGRLVRVVMGVDRAFVEFAQSVARPPADRGPLVLSHRSLDRPLYRVSSIIEAMPAVLAQVPTARLMVGNDGALRPALEDLAKRLGIAGKVTFGGHTPDDLGLARRLAEASVYVSVPISDGTSVTLLQAMAAGAYPVVSDLPANREWIGADNGGVAPIDDVAAIAAAIVRGLREPARRERAAEINLALVRKEGLWETQMDKLEAVYRGLVKIPPG